MPKPKAPAWLRESFKDGVDERYIVDRSARCWLAEHDPHQRACNGPLERFHFIGRQRIENVMWEALRGATIDTYTLTLDEPEPLQQEPLLTHLRDELILIVAWDPRNGGVACEQHHRRFDNHLGPELKVLGAEVPARVYDFTHDYGLESSFHERFPDANMLPDGTLVIA